jgi:hypothetical protein
VTKQDRNGEKEKNILRGKNHLTEIANSGILIIFKSQNKIYTYKKNIKLDFKWFFLNEGTD